MRSVAPLVLTVLAALPLAGCRSGGEASNATSPAPRAARVVTRATLEQQAKLLDRVKALAGEWNLLDEQGRIEPDSRTVIAVSSNGSVVREIMMPGGPYEMTNLYHMDGPNLVVTHYCAMGNQPRMVATPADAGDDRIHFRFASVSNLTADDEECMGDLVLVFLPDGRIRQEWNSIKNGAVSSHAHFTMVRKAS